MHCVADLCVIPIGTGASVSAEVAVCQRVIAEAGLNHKMHAYGTNIEGDWDDVFAVIRRCHEVVHEMGAPRISTSIKVGTRVDRPTSIQTKIDAVRQKMS